jgi:pimeloyl-ACP methyl ester carboxylesterase
MHRLIPAVWTALALARMLPWSTMRKLLASTFVKAVDPCDEQERRFWNAYVAELLDSRLAKADLLANMGLQLEYHRDYHFLPSDLPGWTGSILIAESDNDVIGPSRRKGLRDTYPAAKIHTFHNGGHATMFLRFDEYLAMVKGFLEL